MLEIDYNYLKMLTTHAYTHAHFTSFSDDKWVSCYASSRNEFWYLIKQVSDREVTSIKFSTQLDQKN